MFESNKNMSIIYISNKIWFLHYFIKPEPEQCEIMEQVNCLMARRQHMEERSRNSPKLWR